MRKLKWKSGTREIGNEKWDVRNGKSEFGNEKQEIRNWKSEFGNKNFECSHPISHMAF